MNAEQLEAVRADDARLGEGDEGLQMWPAVYTQRRWLLKAMDAKAADTTTLVTELSGMLEPFSGGTTDLADLVQRLRTARQVRAEIVEAMAAEKAARAAVKPPSECGWCTFEEADGELIEQCAKCKAKDNPPPPAPQRAETGHPMLCGCAECM